MGAVNFNVNVRIKIDVIDICMLLSMVSVLSPSITPLQNAWDRANGYHEHVEYRSQCPSLRRFVSSLPTAHGQVKSRGFAGLSSLGADHFSTTTSHLLLSLPCLVCFSLFSVCKCDHPKYVQAFDVLVLNRTFCFSRPSVILLPDCVTA